MGRGKRTKKVDVSERRCIATGKTLPKTDLIRFVLGPDNTVTPDVSARLPGRGLWVAASKNAVDIAIKQNAFAKAAKQAVVVPEDLITLTQDLIAHRAIGLISIARKGGSAICGFEKVKGAVMSERRHILLQAIDGSEGQKRKLRPQDGSDTFIGCFTAQELGLAFGRESVIHAAVSKGGLSARILLEANRLTGFRARYATPKS